LKKQRFAGKMKRYSFIYFFYSLVVASLQGQNIWRTIA